MRKNILFSLLSLLGVASFGLMTTNQFVNTNAYDSVGTNEWESVSGALKIDSKTNGVSISGDGAFGARVKYSMPVDLDGLSFDFEVANPTFGNQYGFYFSKTPGLYFSEIQPSVESMVFTLIYGPFGTDQTSLYARRNHDYNVGAGPELSYVSPDTSSTRGFHTAGRLVLNTISGAMGLHFDFHDYDENFIKVEISELYSEQIWRDNYNCVVEDGVATVTAYLDKADMSLNGTETYLHYYAMDNAYGGITTFTDLTDKNIQGAVSFSQKVLDELTCDPTGSVAPSTDEWQALKTAYESLSESSKLYLSTDYTGSNDVISAAMEKYDYIVSKYNGEYVDFISRVTTDSIKNNNTLLSSNDYILIIVSISIVSISLISAFVIIKRKKANN